MHHMTSVHAASPTPRAGVTGQPRVDAGMRDGPETVYGKADRGRDTADGPRVMCGVRDRRSEREAGSRSREGAK